MNLAAQNQLVADDGQRRVDRLLINHPHAPRFVERLSALAPQACQAMDDVGLAAVMRDYISELGNWSGNAYTMNVVDAESVLFGQLRDQVFASITPGGGASRSLIVLAASRVGRDAVLDILTHKGWWASPAIITDGIRVEYRSAWTQ